MVDNVRLTDHDLPLAADEIAGAKHLKVKLEYGDNNSATEVSASNPLPVDIGGGTVNINIPSGNLVTTISSGLLAVLSGRIAVTSGEVHVMSGQINAFIQSGTVNAIINSGNLNVVVDSGNITSNVTSGNIAALVSSGEIHVMSGQINSYVTSGEVHIMSGQLNSVVQSGNIDAFITSGNVYITSGNINILNSGTVVSTTNPFPVTYVSSGGGSPVIPISFAAGTTDAFGRLRVGNPFTLFDSQHRYQINDKWNYVTSGGAATVFDTNGSLVNLNLNRSSGSQIVAETKRVMAYQPGKSLLVYTTFTMTNIQENQRQRVGYFGEQNGIYFEMDGTTPYFVLRSYISGSVVETRKAKGTWTVDNLDGSGPSGITLNNFSNSLIFWTDIEWLGVGDVRVGFILNGVYVHCHTFAHSPVSSTPISGTYMTTACLPLRYEITNVGGVAASGNLKQICSTVISEGGYTGFSKEYNASLGTSQKNLTDENVVYPVISIRLASGRMDSIVVPAKLSALVTSNQDVQYRLLLNATISGSSWQTHPTGNVQFDTSATSILSGSGTDITGGYIANQGFVDIGNINDFNFQLGRTINQTSDVLTLAMAATNPNTKVLADFSWYEII